MAAARLLGPAGLARAAVGGLRGLASRGVGGAGPAGREPDPDSDWEPEERELREVASALARREAAIRLQKVRRRLRAAGAPRRTLSREAVEQIRYLHKEFAETWSLPRLAEGFDVSVEVIRRVLKSKFVPIPDQKPKDQRDPKAIWKQPGPQAWVSGGNLKPSSVSHLDAPPRDQDRSMVLKMMKLRVHGADAPESQKGKMEGAQCGRSRVPAPETLRGRQRSLQKHSSNSSSGAQGDGSPE